MWFLMTTYLWWKQEGACTAHTETSVQLRCSGQAIVVSCLTSGIWTVPQLGEGTKRKSFLWYGGCSQKLTCFWQLGSSMTVHFQRDWFEGTASQKKRLSAGWSVTGGGIVQGEKNWKTEWTLKDFSADMNLYHSSHLYKGDPALISSLRTMEVALSFMAKAVGRGGLKVQMISQAYTESECGLGIIIES